MSLGSVVLCLVGWLQIQWHGHPGEENKRVQAVSQLDALRKSTTQRKSSAQEDDAFKAIEPEIDELFAIDEQLVRPHAVGTELNIYTGSFYVSGDRRVV